MKLRVDVAAHSPDPFKLEVKLLRERVIEEIFTPFLKDPAPPIHLFEGSPGPAEFFVQIGEAVCSSDCYFCNACLTNIQLNVNTETGTKGCWEILTALYKLFSDLILKYFPAGSKVQLAISMSLDRHPYGELGSLLKMDPEWVEVPNKE